MKTVICKRRMSALCIVIAAAFGSVHRAAAAEVEVKNDSVTNFSEAFVVGDFIAGEKAGVRLTSPCEGAIVAVQVLWLSAGGNPPATLEEAITVHSDAGTFPVPGAELLLLEGPLLTPGFLNEWRHVDEAGTIPINVPVTMGQSFFVILEFGEDTDVAGGSASVVRDTNGCQPNRNVLWGNFGAGLGWWNFCLLISGDLAIRAVVDCQDPLGACCDVNASCTNNVEEDECDGPGETFFVGQTCGQVTCPVATGACCNGMGGCLDGITQSACETTFGGIYGGNGATCASQICALGACCKPDGGCDDLVDPACAQEGGIFEGPGTSCATTSCPQPLGACCINVNCVSNQTEVNCSGFGGTWQGAFSTCGPPNPCEACNDGDANQDGNVDLLDFAVLQDCFGGSAVGPCECLDMNGDGAIDEADVALFINALSGP